MSEVIRKVYILRKDEEMRLGFQCCYSMQSMWLLRFYYLLRWHVQYWILSVGLSNPADLYRVSINHPPPFLKLERLYIFCFSSGKLTLFPES